MVGKKINIGPTMLQERNTVLETQLKRVLRSNMSKERPYKQKKRKRNSNNDSFEEFDIIIENAERK